MDANILATAGRQTIDPDAAHRSTPRTGVLLVNLGTPDAPTPSAIRRYLAQFLSDRRVVGLPRIVWLPLLYLVVLPLRPSRLAHAYAAIWREDGSPLLAISKLQASALRSSLRQKFGADIPVALAMSYGEPSFASALAELETLNVRRLLLLPLFPQFSASTTAAALDALFAELKKRIWPPELRTVNSYHDDAGYIAALAASVIAHWQRQGRGDHMLMSFHGIPQHYVLAGDPYYCHCQKTARLLAEALQLAPGDWSVSFQSRFGKAPWVQPYTDETAVRLARAGVARLDVICPGFAADCLETLEEISLRYAAEFKAAGGSSLRYVPALNTEDLHIEALTGLISRNLGDWLLTPPAGAEHDQRLARAHRAEASFSGSATASPATVSLKP